jgi:arsenate reductase
LKTPPSHEELRRVLRKLQLPAAELVRREEAAFKEHFSGKTLSEEAWIEAMIQYPKLIQRPIVIAGEHAVIGRPPSNALALLRR